MAVTETIQELLQGIDEAQYGRDMRQFIHKAIQKCYEEGSAGETDLTARNNILKILEMFGNVETGSTASTAYAVGDTLVYDGRLYKVISAISQGDTLTEDTNIEEVTVKEATITPPDFLQIEGVPLSDEPLGDTFYVQKIIPKTGWYSLHVSKNLTASSWRLLAEVCVEIDGDNRTIAFTSTPEMTDTIQEMTPWLFFKKDTTVIFEGQASGVLLFYCPCM